MARLEINVGTNENDGTGDKLRDAMVKINTNFEEVYSLTAGETNIDFTPNTISVTDTNGDLTITPNGTGRLIVSTGMTVNDDAQSDASAQFIMKDSADANMFVIDPLLKSLSINSTATSSGLFVEGNASITGSNIALAANVSLGASSSNTITINGKVGSSLVPTITSTYDIGSTLLKFGNAYLTGVDATSGNIATLGSTTFTTETVNSTYANLGNLTISGTLIDIDVDVLSVNATISTRAVKGTVTRSDLSNVTVLSHPLDTMYSYSPTVGGLQVELPSASGHAGGIVIFRNRSGSLTYSILGPDSATVSSVGTNTTVRVISDGVSWFTA